MKQQHTGLSRSYLFVPGDRPDRFAKALATAADTVIIDLEDAVAPDQKDRARAVVAEFPFAERSICLRINGAGTDWYARDLALCRLPGVEVIMLPKVESAQQIEQLVAAIPAAIPVLPFIETAQGYEKMRDIAGAARVQRLVFGVLDFMLDLGLSAAGDELNSVRLQMVIASRLAGIGTPVDGVTKDIKDEPGLRDDCLRARRLGFGGKQCIHPAQVGVVNACFSHSEEEIAWARKVIAAVAAAQGAVISLDGKMIDRPVLERARIILDQIKGNEID